MKFGDKLILLRKKKGLSQEELAEKLGVSRQSVSKWESNNTYPETDKIVQICNLFECSMDDLINDKITNIEQIERVNKNTLNEAWDSLLDFITKTINMFSQMNFLNGMKCIIELIIVSFLLWIVGLIVCNTASSIISNLFSFLSDNTVNIIHNVIASIFNCIWFILSIIILIHTFKIRYLNEYELTETKKEKIDKTEGDNKEQAKAKTERLNIQNNKKQPYAFLGVLSNIVIYFFKFIACWLSFGFTITIITLVFILFITIFMIPNHIFFGGLSLIFLASTIITSLLLLTSIYFVFSKKIPVKIYCIIFLIATIAFGLGAGISAISLRNIEVIKEENLKEEKIELDYQENMVIYSHPDSKYQYIIDSSMEDGKIKVLTNINSKFESINTNNENEDQMNVYNIYYELNGKLKDMYKEFANNLKKNKIVLPEESNHSVRIYANENTIKKLLDNTKKLYLIEEEVKDNNITITIHESKVFFPNGGNEIYDARNDTLILDDDEQCERSIQSTKWGERIIYTCNEKEDYDE